MGVCERGAEADPAAVVVVCTVQCCASSGVPK